MPDKYHEYTGGGIGPIVETLEGMSITLAIQYGIILDFLTSIWGWQVITDHARVGSRINGFAVLSRGWYRRCDICSAIWQFRRLRVDFTRHDVDMSLYAWGRGKVALAEDYEGGAK